MLSLIGQIKRNVNFDTATLSSLLTEPNTSAKSVDPNETAHNESSHRDQQRFSLWSELINKINLFNNG